MILEYLEFIWKNNLKENFLNGKLIYERQLQALLYHYLITNLESKYHVWIEPVTYFKNPDQTNKVYELPGLSKTKPDLIITDDKEKSIVAIIELKFTPWEPVNEKGDINKLCKFEMEGKNNRKMLLGWEPVSSNWNKQKGKKELVYTLNESTLYGFFVCAKLGSNALNKSDGEVPENFVHLAAYIAKDGDPYFERVPYHS